MRKRILSLLLAAVMVVSLFPAVRAEEAEEADIEALVAEQVDAFVATLKPEGASEGASQLVRNSMKGGGDMKMTEKDAFGKAVFSSELFRFTAVSAVTQLHTALHSKDIRACYLRTMLCWYEHHSQSYHRAYLYDGNDEHEESSSIGGTRGYEEYDGPFNTYDQAMMLVVGESRGDWNVQITNITADTVTYQIDISICDSFAFDGVDYSGDDRELEEFISWVGMLLSMGLLTEFDWELTTTIEFTLPNECTHESGAYHWAYDGEQDLVSVETAEFQYNPLSRLTNNSGKDSYTENDVFYQTSYAPQVPIRLLHDRPWVLEWVCYGDGGSFVFGSQGNTSNGVYLRMAPNTLFFGNPSYLNESDEGLTLCHYGIWLTGDGGVDTTKKHTYTLTNRISDDGTNMVYLSVDGRDMGPMNNYYESGTSGHRKDDWV